MAVSINEMIEKLREELYNLVSKRGLGDKEVEKKSKELDIYLNEYNKKDS